MFAYCENDPVNRSDPTGERPRLISLAVQRLIHNEVANRVAIRVKGLQNVYVKKQSSGKLQRGFLDVYNPSDNSYYEIKSRNSANTKRTRLQMEKYDGSEPAGIVKSQGPITRGTEKISGQFQYLIYDVKYFSMQNGLVVYEASINQKRMKAATTIAITVGLLIAGPAGAGAGALIFA